MAILIDHFFGCNEGKFSRKRNSGKFSHYKCAKILFYFKQNIEKCDANVLMVMKLYHYFLVHHHDDDHHPFSTFQLIVPGFFHENFFVLLNDNHWMNVIHLKIFENHIQIDYINVYKMLPVQYVVVEYCCCYCCLVNSWFTVCEKVRKEI